MKFNENRGHRRRPRYRDRPNRVSRDWSGPVASVLDEYITACAYPPMGSVRLSHDGDSKPRVNPFKMVEFKADCERAFADALCNHSHLVPALQNIIKETAEVPYEPVSAGERVDTIQKLGPVLSRNGLMPWTYFTRVRP